jgi:hypothetical protein
MDGWRYCYKSKPWDRPERIKPWDGDHAEYRRSQGAKLLPAMMKDDLDVYLRGYDGISRPGITNDFDPAQTSYVANCNC